MKTASVSDEIICTTDLLATCAAIVGDSLNDNEGEDNYNILPALLGRKLEKPIDFIMIEVVYRQDLRFFWFPRHPYG